jgi:hypothetical protein
VAGGDPGCSDRLQRRPGAGGSESGPVARSSNARALERAVEAESLLNRERYGRLDAFLAQRGQVIRVAPDSVCGFVHGKAGVIEPADGRKLGFIGSMNELLAFMSAVADRSDHVLLGTATPIQTRREDLWDLVSTLHRGSGGFVLGNDLAPWHNPARVLPILSGEERVLDLDYG